MVQTTGQNLPVSQSPFTNPSDGTLTYDGYQFLLNLLQEAATQQATATVATGLKATGTTQATALQLSSQWNEVDTATLTANGALLSAYSAGQSQTVFNQSGISINVYPPPGSQIDGLGANSPYSLPNGTRITFDYVSSTQIRS